MPSKIKHGGLLAALAVAQAAAVQAALIQAKAAGAAPPRRLRGEMPINCNASLGLLSWLRL